MENGGGVPLRVFRGTKDDFMVEKLRFREGEPEEKAEVSEEALQQFLQSPKVEQFTEEWHKEGYTKIGIHELLTELHIRFEGDEEKALERGDEILSVLIHIDLGKFKIKPEGLVKGIKKLLGKE